MDGGGKYDTPKYSWPFHFPPYNIQNDLMNTIFDTLNDGNIGIFESPTGSGKSLSIICSALHWLKINRGVKLPSTQKVEVNDSSSSDPSWISDFKRESQEEARKYHEEQQKARKSRVELWKKSSQSLEPERSSFRKIAKPKKLRKRFNQNQVNKDCSSDDEFAIDDEVELSDSLISDSESSSQEDDDRDMNIPSGFHKIYFCSRTHSQLSQFMNEIKRTPFGDEVSCVALGSRQQLCSYDSVRRAKSVAAMNEMCLDLRENAKDSAKEGKKRPFGLINNDENESFLIPRASACPLYDRSRVLALMDYILHETVDIESLGLMATKTKSCGYYAARAAIREAEFVALPYSSLLNAQTRSSLGIDLKGSVVIFDEAHNVMNAINDINSTELTLQCLRRGLSELGEYRDRYIARLKSQSKMWLRNLISILRGICRYLADANSSRQDNKEHVKVVTAGSLVIDSGVDHINIFKILEYMNHYKLCQKLNGFSRKYMTGEQGEVLPHEPAASILTSTGKKIVPKVHGTTSLYQVQAFLHGLSNTEQDGKILVICNDRETKLKFLMLNPSVHFRPIFEDARSVVLIGGTMQPTEDVEQQLFDGLEKHRQIVKFSCGHIVPPENIGCFCVGKGPGGALLSLNMSTRSEKTILDEIGECVHRICTMTPGGVVVFLPSYVYSEHLYDQWKKSKLFQAIENHKKIFLERRCGSNTEAMLKDYARACDSDHKGALLFAVVGGKLSEGINFSNQLARCVVMVGLPFPNPNDPELVARMKYLDSKFKLSVNRKASQEYYENQCMKAVNQCIGRAIRHQSDYAAIVLLDVRYSRQTICKKLPRWIGNGMKGPLTFSQLCLNLRQFFASKTK